MTEIKMKTKTLLLTMMGMTVGLLWSGCTVVVPPDRPVVYDYAPPPHVVYDYYVWDGSYFVYYSGPQVVFRDYQPRYRSHYSPGYRVDRYGRHR